MSIRHSAKICAPRFCSAERMGSGFHSPQTLTHSLTHSLTGLPAPSPTLAHPPARSPPVLRRGPLRANRSIHERRTGSLRSHLHPHSPTHSLIHALTHALGPIHTGLSLNRTYIHTFTHSLSHTPSLAHIRFLTRAISHPHPSHSHPLSDTPCLSHTLSHTHARPLSPTFTLIHPLSLSHTSICSIVKTP